MTGSCSKGTAVMSLVGFSGSQATALTAFRPELFNVKLSFFVLTSQTVTNPPLLPVTKMCATFLFQSKQSMSSALAAVLPRRIGSVPFSRSLMKSSPFAPPVARRLGRLGLNWRALIAPLWFFELETKAFVLSSKSLSTFHSPRLPLSDAPAITPLSSASSY